MGNGKWGIKFGSEEFLVFGRYDFYSHSIILSFEIHTIPSAVRCTCFFFSMTKIPC